MKAISLWQPWATLMALGYKTIETRGWRTNYRGPLLIHAAQKKVKMDYDFNKLICKLVQNPLGFPYGAIVCKVDLIECQIMTARNVPSPESLEYELGYYVVGRYMWITEKSLMFNHPIPWKGSQGFFDVPDEIVNKEIQRIGHCTHNQS